MSYNDRLGVVGAGAALASASSALTGVVGSAAVTVGRE